MRWFDDLQRMSTSTENAIASRIARQQVDIADQLPRIVAPTLILQALGDRATTSSNAVEVSPGSRTRDWSRSTASNHILLAGEPAWATFVGEVVGVPCETGRRSARRRASLDLTLTPREREVLELCADGRTNDEIAAALTLSPRTIERHLSNLYGKLGLCGPPPARGSRCAGTCGRTSGTTCRPPLAGGFAVALCVSARFLPRRSA